MTTDVDVEDFGDVTDIVDPLTLDLMVARLAKVRAKRAALADRRKQWETHIADWFEATDAAPAQAEAEIVAAVTAYVTELRRAHPGMTRYPTPSGTVTMHKARRERWHIDDMAALVEWAEANVPGLVDVVPAVPEQQRVLIPALRKVAEAAGQSGHAVRAGEVIPGVTVDVPDPTDFEVRIETS